MPCLFLRTEVERAGHAAAPTRKIDRAYRPSSVSADAEPLRNGMTATGSHEYFYSLRGAQPPGGRLFSAHLGRFFVSQYNPPERLTIARTRHTPPRTR